MTFRTAVALFLVAGVLSLSQPALGFTFHPIACSSGREAAGTTSTLCETRSMEVPKAAVNEKKEFLQSLELEDRLNEASPERTELLNRLIDNKITTDVDAILEAGPNSGPLSVENPGRWESMNPVASGTWNVVYAPHMTTMANVMGGGEFRVQYILHEDGTMESHARLDFPWLVGLKSCYLSVSGTYGSVSDSVCRVVFDEAWVKEVANEVNIKDKPYQQISDVPDSSLKSAISSIGRALFIKEFSVFPISYMDNDLCVFDFELLGTRICARKVSE